MCAHIFAPTFSGQISDVFSVASAMECKSMLDPQQGLPHLSLGSPILPFSLSDLRIMIGWDITFSVFFLQHFGIDIKITLACSLSISEQGVNGYAFVL